jgi:hypothetical protein
MKSFLMTFGFFVALTSCGSGTAVSSSIDTHTQVSGGSNLTTSSTAIEGSGAVLFSNSLGSTDSGTNFTLTFTLDEGGSLKLHSYASNELTGGIDVQFTRAGTALSVVVGSASPSVLTGIDASGEIKITFDTHNDEAPAHVLIWNGTASTFTPEAAILELDGETGVGNGTGTFWGLTLSTAKVKLAKATGPKFEEE